MALFNSMDQLIGRMRDASARRSGLSLCGDDDSTRWRVLGGHHA